MYVYCRKKINILETENVPKRKLNYMIQLHYF